MNLIRKILPNIALVATLQWLSFLASFITLPILTSRLGLQTYGILAFCLAVNAYFLMWVDFGTSNIGAREVSKEDLTQEEMATIFSKMFFIRLTTFSIGITTIYITAKVLPDTESLRLILAGCMLTGIGAIFFPNWYLEGRQQIKKSAALLFAARVIQIICILRFVESQDDLMICLIIESSINVIAGTMLLFTKNSNWKIKAVELSKMHVAAKSSSQLLLSNAIISLYTASGVILLSFISGAAAAGLFSLADKVTNAGKRLLSPAFSAVFPYFSRLAFRSRAELQAARRTYLPILLLCGASISTILFAGANLLVSVISTPAFEDSILLIKMMSPIPFLVCISNYFGVQTLLVENLHGVYARIVAIAGVSGFLLTVLSIRFFGTMGAAVSITFIEAAIALITFLAVMRIRTK